MQISVENAKGTRRHWYDEHGDETGSSFMHHDYGYIRGTKGTDGDHVDVYVGPNPEHREVHVVTQMKKPDFREVDEQKVMLGFPSAKHAKAAYLKQYDDPRFFGSMKTMDVDAFKRKVFPKENHGKLVKAERGPAASHKYKSRRPDGKGGWIYEYDTPEKTTGRTGAMPLREEEVRRIVDQLLSKESILGDSHPAMVVHANVKELVSSGKIPEYNAPIKIEPGKVVGTTKMMLRGIDNLPQRVDIAFTTSREPSSSVTGACATRIERGGPSGGYVNVSVTLPAGTKTLGWIREEARRVLAHELTHARDVIHMSKKDQEDQDDVSSPESYKRYRNQKIEVTAKIKEITRELMDVKAHEDLVSSARDEMDYKGTDFENDFKLRKPLEWALEHSSVFRHAHYAKIYTPKNEKRILRAIADTYQAILEGRVKPIRKALILDIRTLAKSQKPPGAGWEMIPGGKKGGYRRRKGGEFEYWYPDGAHESPTHTKEDAHHPYTEEDFESGNFDKDPMHWIEVRGEKPNLHSKAPVKYAGRVAKLYQIIEPELEGQPGYAVARDVATGEKMAMQYQRILALRHDVNRGKKRAERAENGGTKWTPEGRSKGPSFNDDVSIAAGQKAPKFESSQVDREKKPGVWAIENGVYPMKRVVRVQRTADGRMERENKTVIGVPDYGKQQIIQEFEGGILAAAKKTMKSLGLKSQHVRSTDGSEDATLTDLQRAGVEGLLHAIDNYKGHVPFAMFADRYVHDYIRAAASRERLGGVALDHRFERNLPRFMNAKQRAQVALGKTDVSAEDIARFLDLKKKHVIGRLDTETGSSAVPMQDYQLSIKDKGLKDTRVRPGRISIAQAYLDFLSGEGGTGDAVDETAAYPALHMGFGLDPEQTIIVRQETESTARKLASFVYRPENGRETAYTADMHDMLVRKFGLVGDTDDEPSLRDLADQVPIYKVGKDGKKVQLSADRARLVLPEMLSDALSKLAKDSEGRTRALIEQAANVVVPPPRPAPGPTFTERLQERAKAVTPAQLGEYRARERERLETILATAKARSETARSPSDAHLHENAAKAAREAMAHLQAASDDEIRMRIAKTASPLTKEMRNAATAVVDVDPQNAPPGFRYAPVRAAGRSLLGILRDPSKWTRAGAPLVKSDEKQGTLGARTVLAMQRYPMCSRLLFAPEHAAAEAPTKARKALERLTGEW